VKAGVASERRVSSRRLFMNSAMWNDEIAGVLVTILLPRNWPATKIARHWARDGASAIEGEVRLDER
jgi:hypothetical protein